MSFPRILLDIDGVVADLVGALCEEVGEITPKDFHTYSFDDCGFEGWKLRAMKVCMSTPGFCANLPLYPGAQEFCDRLQELGDVVAVTKPYPTGQTWAYEREDWCWRIGIRKVIHTSHKECIKGDLLIEDSADNAARWYDEWSNGRVVLIDRPWNQLQPNSLYSIRTSRFPYVRAKNFEGALKAVAP